MEYLAIYINKNLFYPPNTAFLLPNLSPFLFGSCLAIYYVEFKDKLPCQDLSNFLACFSLFGLMYAVPIVGKKIISSAVGSEFLYHNLFANPLGISINGSIFLLCLFNNKSIIINIMNSKALNCLGKISFSIYCLHILPASLLGFLVPILGPSYSVFLFTCVTIVLATTTYYLIERPIKIKINEIDLRNKKYNDN